MCDRAFDRVRFTRTVARTQERQTEIAVRIEQHQRGEGDFWGNAGKPDFSGFACWRAV